jgi:cytidyltransferase-like protein
MRPLVFVSGCFDLLHSGHVAFLQTAAEHGDLIVAVGSDTTVVALKGRPPVCPASERLYLVQSLRYVERAFISSGSGYLDFEPELRRIRPQLFVVNEDGDCSAKRALCESLGIEYRVLRRKPAHGLPPRTTTALRSQQQLPHRLEISGGWLDQPMVSSLSPGPVIVASIWPDFEVPVRCGLATSAHQTATRIWGNQLPAGMNPRLAAEILFAVDNPPGTTEIAGSQDSFGLTLPGINRLFYRGGYLPEQVDAVHDPATLDWLEKTIHLVPTRPRPSGYSPLVGMQLTADAAGALSRAATRTWAAIEQRDAALLGRSLSECLAAQVKMFPAMLDDNTRTIVDAFPKSALGWKFTGAGGGGFLLVVNPEPVDGACGYRIRRLDD